MKNIQRTMRQVVADRIMVDSAESGGYQRKVDQNRVMKIVRGFETCSTNVIKLSFRDGVYYVIDGQHTLEAIKIIHAGIRDGSMEAPAGWETIVRDMDGTLVVNCSVFTGLTRADEARAFVNQSGFVSNVKRYEKLHALYNARDQEACALVDQVRQNGLDIQFTKQNKIGAVATLEKLKEVLTSPQFDRTLQILKRAYNGDPESLSSSMLWGMGLFVKEYDGCFDEESLVSRLATTPVVEITRNAKALQMSGNARYARVILMVYNRQRQKKLKDKFD